MAIWKSPNLSNSRLFCEKPLNLRFFGANLNNTPPLSNRTTQPENKHKTLFLFSFFVLLFGRFGRLVPELVERLSDRSFPPDPSLCSSLSPCSLYEILSHKFPKNTPRRFLMKTKLWLLAIAAVILFAACENVVAPSMAAKNSVRAV